MLTLREKAAQLVFARLGSNIPPPVKAADDAGRVTALLERCPLGGLLLFNGDVTQTPSLLAGLQRRSRYPLLVGADLERGAGQQLAGATIFPHAMALGAAEGGASIEAVARATAREALACGLHITFAPVADVNRDPRNPIIATRAFGTEPEQVARGVAAYIRGCRAEGLLTTAKHFPGHGGTPQDSHAETPVVEEEREVLERLDLPPFRTAVAEGVDLMMTAHVAYPAFDASGRPATLSRPILQTLLREELGFGGLVVTDSLLMGGIKTWHGEPGNQAAALLNAGVDLLLDPEDPEGVVDGLVRTVQEGILAEARLEEAFTRIWGLKQSLVRRFGETFFEDPAMHFDPDEVGSEAHRRLAEEVAQQAVTVIRAAPEAFPLDPATAAQEGVLVMLIRPDRSSAERPFGAAVRAALPGVRYTEVGPEAGEDLFRTLKRRADEAQHVVVAAVVRPAAWQAFGLQPDQEQFVQGLMEERPVVLAALGSPSFLDAFPQAAALLCTYSDTAPSQRALAAALAGAVVPQRLTRQLLR